MFRRKEIVIEDCRKFPENSKYKVGDIVEFLYKGNWILGKIKESDYDGSIDVWRLGRLDYQNLYDCKIRYTSETIAKAKKYFEQLIKFEQDSINHKVEKDRIKEYKQELNKLR